MKTAHFVLIAVFLLIIGSGGVSGQTLDRPYSPTPALFIPHACVDPQTGDFLIISNSWRDRNPSLRRFHPDGTSDENFVLQRFESCCAIHPSLVAANSEGFIYTLEYNGELGGFFIYKHHPSGELDIDWGQRHGSTTVVSPTPDDNQGNQDATGGQGAASGGYESGETSLVWNAGGGRLDFNFSDPVDLIPRADGSLLVLDRGYRYVYMVDLEGKTVTEFIGKNRYYPIRPQRLLQDPEGNLYLLDYYDEYDVIHEGKPGVFKFSPDGEWINRWGEGAGGINDPWLPAIDRNTIVIDGGGVMMVLGGDPANGNHDTVYAFDLQTGDQSGFNRVQYQLGYDDNYAGIVGSPQSGFVMLEGRDFDIIVSNYTPGGIRESQVRISDLYNAD